MSDLLTLAEMMSRHTVSVAPDCPLAEAAARMAELSISSILVIEGRALRGIVTEHDLLHALRGHTTPATPVSAIMSAPVLTAHHSLGYREAYQLASGNGVRHLVVVDDAGEPIGIVTHTDFRQRLGLGPFPRPIGLETLNDAPAAAQYADEQQQRGNLDAVFAALTELVFVLDTDTRLLHVNPAVTRLLGYTEAELIGRPAVDVHPADHRDEARATLAGMLAGTVDTCLIPLIARDGTEIAVETRIGHGSWDGRPALIAVARDIRARVAAESKLRQLSTAVEQSPLTIIITDTEGNIEYANSHFELVTGYRREEMLGQNPRLLQSGETPLATYQALWAAITAGKTWRGELKNRRKDGSFYWESAVISPVQDSRGAITNYLAIKQDVTAQRAAEERLRLAASVFEHAHEGIVITDPNGAIVEVNNAFSDLTGYAREEVLGRNPSLLQSDQQTPEFYAAMWQTLLRQGYWRGELWNRRKNGELFAELLTITAVRSPDGTLSHYVGIFSDITQIKQHQQRLEYLAHYDPLTQLPNRALLADRIQQALAHTLRSGDLLAVCYLDLDAFKPVNDTHGHEAGDQLLIEIASRLKSALRGGDTVARLGGDEFVLLLGDLASIEEGEQALTRLLGLIAAPLTIAGHEIAVSASIGLTLFPLDHADADTLLRHADQAMYVAKQSGRNRFHLFDTEHDRRVRSHHEAFSRIEAALAAGEFCLYFQPQVDMRLGAVIGAEALIRWQHPERGLVPPGEFLPLIENTELDIALGEWVLETALRQMEAWQANGFALKISVNISAHHLQGENFTSHLQALRQRHASIAHGQLELEVLETAALQDMGRVSRVIDECRQLGLSFSLDDFGTGYSSLTYFRRLSADTLKIDQSFVRDMLDDADDLAIVEGIIGLTRAFNRSVIAEGVETAEHGLLLLQLGCDLAQGYGIARPMPAADLPGWIARFRPDPLWEICSGFNWRREDLPMLTAETEHRRWIDRLSACVERGESAGVPNLDHHACRFGRWYESHGRERYGGIDDYADIGLIHEQVHARGAELMALVAAGRGGEAKARLPELHGLRDRLLDRLYTVQATVLMGD
ncbi:MAG: EAL domain-containing protein [Sulfurisoma sp.]|nr:EAL domain-containing protein [Sulfurisoma sp.]